MMRAVLSWLLAWMIVVVSMTNARTARADDERVIVVVVTESAAELDAERLRTLIAKELRARVVTPADPAASAAQGTVTIEVDRASGELSVSYVAHATPTTRHVPLPGDLASARSAAVVLAGNLARDEASELAAELRRRKPAAPSSDSPQQWDAESGTGKNDDELRRDGLTYGRLQATLDFHAKREAGVRKVGWAFGVGTSLAVTAIIATAPGFDEPLPAVVTVLGASAPLGAAIGASAMAYTQAGVFEELADEHRKGEEKPGQTEEHWRDAARTEHKGRRIIGIAELGFGALALGAATVAVAEPSMFTSDSRGNEFTAIMIGVGAAEVILGVYMLTSEGSVESALHAYEASTGRVGPPKQSWLEHFDVGVAPGGGAMARFALTF